MIYETRFGRINYEETGNGSPVLLIHDICFCERRDPCASRLSENFRVFAPDLLGFGKSDKPAMEYSAYLYASFINNFIKDVIREPAVVIARGRGAAFSVMAAAFSPGNFKKLYLIKPKGMPAPPVKGVARAFFVGADADVRYALAKGRLDADYKRALKELSVPVKIITGKCKLCQKLLAKQSDFAAGKPDMPEVSGSAGGTEFA